jgi:hypothetical protein
MACYTDSFTFFTSTDIHKTLLISHKPFKCSFWLLAEYLLRLSKMSQKCQHLYTEILVKGGRKNHLRFCCVTFKKRENKPVATIIVSAVLPWKLWCTQRSSVRRNTCTLVYHSMFVLNNSCISLEVVLFLPPS